MPPSRTAARFAALVATLGLLAVPVAILAQRSIHGVTLLKALYYSVPVALVLALTALVVSGRARVGAQRSVFANRGGPVRSARLLAWLALYVGVTACVAIAVYWLLRARH